VIVAAVLAVAACEACHGPGGNSETAGTPSIAGQPETFLVNQLIFFREELRASPVMQPLAKGMSDQQAIELARHFSKSPARSIATGPADAKLRKRGRDLATEMRCGQCHLPNYRGRAQMPRLAAQREDYLAEALRAYRDNKRTGADTTMAGVLYGVSDPDIAALAHFLSRLR
jgi:cytochrome c553